MKIINIGELQNQPGFGDVPLSSRSRADLIKASLALQLYPPLFDREGLFRSLSRMFENTSDLRTFFPCTQQLVDTFFYPASVLSFAIQGESNLGVKNMATYAGIERDQSDWNLSNPMSIANYARRTERILIFPNLVTPEYQDFLGIPFDYYKLYALESVDARNVERGKTLITYESVKDVSDFRLIRSAASTGTESAIPKLSSAVLAPLIFQKKFLGMMLIGFETINEFTFDDTLLMKEENIVDLVMMVEHLSAILAKIKQ